MPVMVVIRRLSRFPAGSLPRLRFWPNSLPKPMIARSFSVRREPKKKISRIFSVRQGNGARATTLSPDRAVGRATQHDAGGCTGVSRVLDDDDPVDQYRRPAAGRVLVRVGVSRVVLEVSRVEDR